MARRRFPPAYACVKGAGRFLGWANAVGVVVVLAYMANRWSDKGGPVAAGMFAVSLPAEWPETARH